MKETEEFSRETQLLKASAWSGWCSLIVEDLGVGIPSGVTLLKLCYCARSPGTAGRSSQNWWWGWWCDEARRWLGLVPDPPGHLQYGLLVRGDLLTVSWHQIFKYWAVWRPVTWLASCTESETSSSCPETRGEQGRALCTRRLSRAEEDEEEDPSSFSAVSAWWPSASDTSHRPPAVSRHLDRYRSTNPEQSRPCDLIFYFSVETFPALRSCNWRLVSQTEKHWARDGLPSPLQNTWVARKAFQSDLID